MKRLLVPFAGLLLAAAPLSSPHWTEAQLDRLDQWLEAADGDALDGVAPERAKLRAARADNPQAIDAIATAAAIHLLDAHRHGCCERTSREGWKIPAETEAASAADTVAAGVAANDLDRMFANARPFHPYYLALRRAYVAERDPALRSKLAANLDRWRWMPRRLGGRYLLVNSASFEATLWQDGKPAGRWQVVVGKQRSPTPIFAASVTGVTFNPWWEIPASIVEESVGAMMRNRPAEAARKGYVVEGGRYRQRPGPQNALGRMKLAMFNPYNVYLHDTPAQSLFDRDVRAFSHGCVRVGDALGLATALLRTKPGWTRASTDEAVAAGKTTTIALDRPIPVYITYFTAEPDDDGGIRYFPDVYERDRVPAAATPGSTLCTR